MRLLERTLFATILLLGTVFATNETVGDPDLGAKKVIADSLQQAADSLDAKAIELEKQLDGIEESQSDLRDEIEDQLEDLREAIDDIREQVESTLDEIRDDQEEAVERLEERIEDREERRHAGSFIFGIEYAHLDTDPLRHLQNTDPSLSDSYSFDFNDNNMLMFGLMGYYNLQNNVRVGNGLYAGYKSFQSDEYSTTVVDSLLNTTEQVDSIVTLRVIPMYIGFICEKAFVFEPVNFFAGIMLGGNLSFIIKEEERAQANTSFISDDYSDESNSEYSFAFAPAVAWDVHGGMAFRLSEHMHIGIDGVVRFAYAYEGYGAGFGDFLSVSPGVRLRLTFGNAG
jgi:gas vesicle protein